MPPTLNDPPAPHDVSAPPFAAAPPVVTDSYALSLAAQTHERRNFLVLALYQIVIRIGWIFKTESIVMPAVLDTITGGGAAGGMWRGCLPTINRLGHSIPPLLFSRRMKLMPCKSAALAVCTLAMATMFAALSVMWWIADGFVHAWMPPLFLACYALFFAATGVNNLAFGTLQGKLIHATRRGRLMLAANVIGAACAITAVALLMPRWLSSTGGQFEFIFAFTAGCFACGAVITWFLREPSDDYEESGRGVQHLFASAWQVVRSDRNFGRLAFTAMAFSSSLLLFPHYQALGRRAPLSLSFDNLLVWLIIQNTGTALFSLIAGPAADRYGNRLVMRCILFGVAAMPVTAIALSHWPAWGQSLYPGVFLLIGLTPVGFKTFNNYTLEISPPEEHSRYLATLGMCYALPLMFSPAVGWIVESVGFEGVFITVTGLVLAGWIMTYRLDEPRDLFNDGSSERY